MPSLKFFKNPYVVIFLITVFVTFDYYLFGVFSYAPRYDEANSAVPFRFSTARDLKQHFFSYWMPQYFAGVDRSATALNPDLDVHLYAWLPLWLAYGLEKFLVPFIATAGLFHLLRTRFAVAIWPALAGAVLFGITEHQYFGKFYIAGLPIIFLLMTNALAREKHGWIVAALAGALYGWTTILIYSALTTLSVVYWVFVIERQRNFRAVAILVAFGLGLLFTEWETIWAALANGPFLQRAHHDHSIPFTLGSLFERLKHFELWVAVLLTAVACVSTGGAHGGAENAEPDHSLPDHSLPDRTLRSAGTVLAIGLFCHFSPFLYWVFAALLWDYVAVLKGADFRIGNESRIWFCMCMALGFHRLASARGALAGKNWRRISAAAMIALSCVPMGRIWVEKIDGLWEMLHTQNFAYFFRQPDVLARAESTKDDPPFRVATPFILSDTGYFEPTYLAPYGMDMIDGHVNAFPDRFRNYWRAVNIKLRELNPGRFKEFGFVGYGSNRLYLFAPRNDWGPVCPDGTPSCPVDFENTYNLNLLSAANVGYVISARRLTSAHLELLPSSMREILAKTEKGRMRDKLLRRLRGEYVGPPLYIYRNTKWMPRYRVVGNILEFQNKHDVVAALSRASVDDLRSTGFVLRADAENIDLAGLRPPHAANPVDPPQVKEVERQADCIRLSVEVAGESVLVVANNFTPFWKAEINGQTAPVFPINLTFQGVVVKKGRQEITLSYQPPYSLRAALLKNAGCRWGE